MPFAPIILASLLVINFLVMGFRFAYHRGFKLKSLLLPLCHGVGLTVVIFIMVESSVSIEEMLNMEVGIFFSHNCMLLYPHFPRRDFWLDFKTSF